MVAPPSVYMKKGELSHGVVVWVNTFNPSIRKHRQVDSSRPARLLVRGSQGDVVRPCAPRRKSNIVGVKI